MAAEVSSSASQAAQSHAHSYDNGRRRLLGGALAGSGLALLSSRSGADAIGDKSSPQEAEEELRFPGDPPDNKVVYQFNKSDEDYHQAVLFSVGAMLRKYGDNIHIVVVGIGPGIHVLAKNPKRPVSEKTREKIASLLVYGVEFHACGNTMKALKWEAKDMLDSVKIVEVGAADLMELQQQGYAYLSW